MGRGDSVEQARDDVLADRIHCFEMRETGEEVDDSGWPSAATDISEGSTDGDSDGGGAAPSGAATPAWAKLPAGDIATARLGCKRRKLKIKYDSFHISSHY